MKRYFFLLVVLSASTILFAQQLTVKTVNMRPQDVRARTNPRDDAKGKKCAIIRVGVVGVENLVFPDSVGNVERSLSEYVVYVPEGLKSLKYKTKAGTNLGEIIFDDWGMEIESLKSYDVLFESDSHLRSAIFSIQPKNAQLVFNGEKVNVDSGGMAMINRPMGEYSYQITADGFKDQSGIVTLTEDDISTVTDVVLQEILYPVTINVSPENATVFIDNVPCSKDSLANLQLPGGNHHIRVTAPNYEDDNKTIYVRKELTPIRFTLKENEEKLVVHSEERTKTSINIRNAFYITGSFAMSGTNKIGDAFGSGSASKIGVELSAVQHFGGIFGIREGASFNILLPNNNESYFDLSVYNDSTHLLGSFDFPLQFSVSIPFGKYNRHLFNIFVGGYGNYIWMFDKTQLRALTEEEKKRDIPDVDDKDRTYFDYGIRVSGKLDIGHFTIGLDLSQSFHKKGFSIGANAGIKLYSLRKKNKS